MIDAHRSFDCLVIGGGPAGSVMAARLAEWGHKVALCDAGGAAGALPAELVEAEAAPTLKRHGCMSSVRAHGFTGPRARGRIWGDGELRWQEAAPPRRVGEADGRGFRIRRSLFDADLRRLARGAGATVLENTRVLGPLPFAGEGSVRILDAEGREETLLVRRIALAAGRGPAAELLPTSLRRQLPRTAVLGARLCGRGLAPLHLEASVTEAVPEGWLWWIPLEDGDVWLGLVTDPEELKTHGARRLFDSALRHAGGPAAQVGDRIQDVEEVGPTARYPGFGANATARLLDTPSAILLAGDSASSIDPICAAGIEKAMISGENAAVALNTALDRPALTTLALEHHRQFEASLWDRFARQAMRRYLEETRFSDHPFWSLRHESVRIEIEATPAATDFPRRLRPHPQLCARPALVRRGNALAETRGFALPDSDETLATLERVPLAPLIETLRRHPRVEGLLEESARDSRLYLVSRGQVLRALTELIRLGMIVEAREGEDGG